MHFIVESQSSWGRQFIGPKSLAQDPDENKTERKWRVGRGGCPVPLGIVAATTPAIKPTGGPACGFLTAVGLSTAQEVRHTHSSLSPVRAKEHTSSHALGSQQCEKVHVQQQNLKGSDSWPSSLYSTGHRFLVSPRTEQAGLAGLGRCPV